MCLQAWRHARVRTPHVDGRDLPRAYAWGLSRTQPGPEIFSRTVVVAAAQSRLRTERVSADTFRKSCKEINNADENQHENQHRPADYGDAFGIGACRPVSGTDAGTFQRFGTRTRKRRFAGESPAANPG